MSIMTWERCSSYADGAMIGFICYMKTVFPGNVTKRSVINQQELIESCFVAAGLHRQILEAVMDWAFLCDFEKDQTPLDNFFDEDDYASRLVVKASPWQENRNNHRSG